MAGYSVAGAGAVPFIDIKLKQRKVALFTKSYSPECKKVKDILDTYQLCGQDYEICEIQSRQDCTQIENYFHILCLSDTRTVCGLRMFIIAKALTALPFQILFNKRLSRIYKNGNIH